MSDYDGMFPPEDEIKARGDVWFTLVQRLEALNETENDETDICFNDILDYDDDDDNDVQCEETNIDSDNDDDHFLDENKDKIIQLVDQKKKFFTEKGLFETLNFQGMNWIQSKISQSFLGSGSFGQTSYSQHHEFSIFTFSNSSQMSFSNSSLMQQAPANFFNPILRTNSMQTIYGMPPMGQPQLEPKPRSISTNSFAENYKNPNIRAIEDVVKCSSLQNKKNYPTSSSSDERSDQQRSRFKKVKRNHQPIRKIIPKPKFKTIIISSESESDFINETLKSRKPQNSISVAPKIQLNSDPDKTLTKEDVLPSQRHHKTASEKLPASKNSSVIKKCKDEVRDKKKNTVKKNESSEKPIYKITVVEKERKEQIVDRIIEIVSSNEDESKKVGEKKSERSKLERKKLTDERSIECSDSNNETVLAKTKEKKKSNKNDVHKIDVKDEKTVAEKKSERSKLEGKRIAERSVENSIHKAVDENKKEKSKIISGYEKTVVENKNERSKLERKRTTERGLESSDSNNETVLEKTKEKSRSKQNDVQKINSGCEKTVVEKKNERPKLERKKLAERSIESSTNKTVDENSKEKNKSKQNDVNKMNFGCEKTVVEKKNERSKVERKRIAERSLDSSDSNNETVLAKTKENSKSKKNDVHKINSGCEKTVVEKKTERPKLERKKLAERSIESSINQTVDKNKKEKSNINSGCEKTVVENKNERSKLDRKKLAERSLESSDSNNETVLEETKEKNRSKQTDVHKINSGSEKTVVEKKNERPKLERKRIAERSIESSINKTVDENRKEKRKNERPKLERKKNTEKCFVILSDCLEKPNKKSKEKSHEDIKKIIVNSTGVSDLSEDNTHKFNENSISSFNELSTIKPPPEKPKIISIHRPIIGDRRIIRLKRSDLLKVCEMEIADEILGNEPFLQFAADSELYFEPVVKYESLDNSDSDDAFLRDITNKRGKLVIIRKR